MSKFIIDTHAHIDQMQDIDGGLRRAADAGVSDIVAIGMNLQSNKDLLKIASQTQAPRIHVGLGLHPSDVLDEVPAETMAFVRDNIQNVTCVGEVGLDYQYKEFYQNETAQQIQRDAFQLALAIARDFDKPIVIHSRKAEADCLRMTKEAGVKRALFHWYSGPVEIMEKILDEGYYVSTSPAVGFSGFSRKAMKYAPLDRILIETDTPVFYRNKDKSEQFRAEPKDVWRTLSALAAWKNVDEHELLDIVNGNARTFFRWEH